MKLRVLWVGGILGMMAFGLSACALTPAGNKSASSVRPIAEDLAGFADANTVTTCGTVRWYDADGWQLYDGGAEEIQICMSSYQYDTEEFKDGLYLEEVTVFVDRADVLNEETEPAFLVPTVSSDFDGTYEHGEWYEAFRMEVDGEVSQGWGRSREQSRIDTYAEAVRAIASIISRTSTSFPEVSSPDPFSEDHTRLFEATRTLYEKHAEVGLEADDLFVIPSWDDVEF